MRKIIPILISICLLTLLSAQAALADDASLGGQVTVLLAREATASISTSVKVSTEATAVDGSGQTIAVDPAGYFSLEISESTGKAILPIALPVGETLDSFSDTETGLELSRTKFTVPVKDIVGTLTATITGDIEKIEGKGVNTEVTAKNLILKSEEFQVDLTSVNRKIGKVAASFQTSLKALPQGAALKATVSKEPDVQARAAFQLAVMDEGKKIDDIACVLNVERTNLENGTDLGEATIIMKAGLDWIEQYGVGNVYIMHYSDDGESRRLETEYIGEEGDQGVFQAISPDGFSLFGLAGVTLPSKDSNWGLIMTSIGSSIIAGLLLLGFIIRRRRGEELVLVRWSTGTSSEDWMKWK